MQQQPLDPEELHLVALANARTRLYTKASPGHPNGLGLFHGLTSPPPRKHLPTPSPAPELRPGLTPWMYDWDTEKNDLLPADGFDFWGDDIPNDGFSLGVPLETTNYWEKPWIRARVDKRVQEIVKRKERALKRKQSKRRSIPLSRAGRKRAWKKRAEGTPERENGKFIKKEEVIIIGED